MSTALTIRIADTSFQVDPGPHLAFWSEVADGAWEPETFAIFDRHITADTLYLDIGAWVGSTVLYAAQKARHSIAFEPDPVAFAELGRNLAANRGAAWLPRIELHNAAINGDGASFTLGGSRDGSDSTSSALFPGRESRWTVHARRLPDVLAAHRTAGQPVFLKIDIEGGEYDLLPAIADLLADPAVTAFLSFHPRMLRRSLSQRAPDQDWREPWKAAHLRLVESLPWARRVTLADGGAVSRERLVQKIRDRCQFPAELLVSAA